MYLALGSYIVKRTSLTDSQIVLFWISNLQLRLKKWPRNRVISIHRLTNFKDWFYIDGQFMTADLGTRKGAKLSDVSEDSKWVNGEDWLKYDRSGFSSKSAEDLTLSHDDLKAHKNELLKSDVVDSELILRQLSDTYFSSYSVFYKYAQDKIRD